jgi:hypothetical protein
MVHDAPEPGGERYFVDSTALINGTAYYYREYRLVAGTWETSPAVSATPSGRATVQTPDVSTLVRERLEAGLKIEVAAGRLRHKLSYVPCLTAAPQFEGTEWPIVTVHLASLRQAVRAIGEALAPSVYDAGSDMWSDSDGWLNSVQLDIIGWVTVSADARIALRKAMEKVLAGNLAVFENAGMIQVDYALTDTEDFESYGAPVFQVQCVFTCLAPFVIASAEAPVRHVEVTLNP